MTADDHKRAVDRAGLGALPLLLYELFIEHRVSLHGAHSVVLPGPSHQGDPRAAVLGDDGLPHLYGLDHDTLLRWYRYLFLGRGKPSTHVRVLSAQDPAVLTAGAPEELRALLSTITSRPVSPPPVDD